MPEINDGTCFVCGIDGAVQGFCDVHSGYRALYDPEELREGCTYDSAKKGTTPTDRVSAEERSKADEARLDELYNYDGPHNDAYAWEMEALEGRIVARHHVQQIRALQAELAAYKAPGTVVLPTANTWRARAERAEAELADERAEKVALQGEVIAQESIFAEAGRSRALQAELADAREEVAAIKATLEGTYVLDAEHYHALIATEAELAAAREALRVTMVTCRGRELHTYRCSETGWNDPCLPECVQARRALAAKEGER